MPTVSVIMSVYNTNDAQVLQLSIQSILVQTFADFELIICDDGSTDDTYDILANICKCDSRIRLYKNDTNLKAAASRNRCISLSQGKYVAIMDADDCSAENRLEKQVAFLEQYEDYDFVGSSADLFDERGIWGRRTYENFPKNKDFLFVLPFVHASVLFRKNALVAIGGYRVARETARTEDYDLFMRLYANGSKGANLALVLYLVREDKAAYKRRKYRFRIDEVLVRYKGFKALGLLPAGYIYVVKPLIVGIIPQGLLKRAKDIYYNRKKAGGL
ncbi:Glycosyltransferase involved in cell wall bisynthesis [Paenibacillus sp. UNCCL117]|uniref:glycosyltransferase family 2 protein n=1 Tax=unclassified Paenibacillus TaxID=185978 RepID=UPI00088E7669|nr:MULTISPECIES: glycosyltransferase [unclassified Paenibacillus]SDD91330.1 Glycosyltransferase involved in cell wall bisynthesis [Paenibacillus sp. cl123]SFW43734.1 Glycosyltransferase involved in cell wall bisynthesis [Paenibacillus sp. UNCCL117]